MYDLETCHIDQPYTVDMCWQSLWSCSTASMQAVEFPKLPCLQSLSVMPCNWQATNFGENGNQTLTRQKYSNIFACSLDYMASGLAVQKDNNTIINSAQASICFAIPWAKRSYLHNLGRVYLNCDNYWFLFNTVTLPQLSLIKLN